jgi:rhodanese-related sulfurtransferase
MKTAQELIAEVKARIKEISVRDALDLFRKKENVTFLDVRDQNEVNLGKIPGAVHISRGTMETKIEAVIPRDARVVVYCASGNRSAFAAETLRQMGYKDVASMAGGIKEWAMSGGDVE